MRSAQRSARGGAGSGKTEVSELVVVHIHDFTDREQAWCTLCTPITLVHIVHVALALRCRLVRLRTSPAADAAVLEVDVGRGVVILHGRHPVLGADELEHEVAQRARLRQREAELAASRTARAGAWQRRLLLLGRLGLVVDRVEAEPRDREEPLG